MATHGLQLQENNLGLRKQWLLLNPFLALSEVFCAIHSIIYFLILVDRLKGFTFCTELKLIPTFVIVFIHVLSQMR